jgi:hypothetical protein
MVLKLIYSQIKDCKKRPIIVPRRRLIFGAKLPAQMALNHDLDA